jgi:hypothetical protein
MPLYHGALYPVMQLYWNWAHASKYFHHYWARKSSCKCEEIVYCHGNLVCWMSERSRRQQYNGLRKWKLPIHYYKSKVDVKMFCINFKKCTVCGNQSRVNTLICLKRRPEVTIVSNSSAFGRGPWRCCWSLRWAMDMAPLTVWSHPLFPRTSALGQTTELYITL